MTSDLGAWLRQQRENRGWSRREMARRIIQLGRDAGDNSMPSVEGMCHNIHRWERGHGGLTERYKLAYCRVLGIQPGQFGSGSASPPVPVLAGGRACAAGQLPVTAAAGVPHLHGPAAVAYRGRDDLRTADFAVEREVLMAAHEGSEHAEQAENHGIGEATSEQLRADLVRLSRLTDTGEPLPVFVDMRRVRGRIYRLLDRRLWPREQNDLYFLLGCLNGLMGVTANRLGYPDAAEELLRAGWAYATAIDNGPLLAQLRQQMSYVAYWRGEIRQSRDLAASGLWYLNDGPAGAQLHLNHARAEARLGNVDAARQAVAAAHEARARDYNDDLLEIGGEFAVSAATHHCLAGTALAEARETQDQAAAELARAIGLYDAGPAGPGEQHWFGGKPLAGIDLAVIRLRSGALDAAVTALEPVLSLPFAQRITAFTTRLQLVRTELAAPVYRRSGQARVLDEQIEEFVREVVTTGLPVLPPSPS